jgi:hypothetical protein
VLGADSRPCDCVSCQVGVLVGALCAGLLRWESGFSASRLDNTVLRDERFSASFFMTFLLPPIIFDAGFNIDTPSALRNLFPITFFAFVGTTFSTAVVGLVTYGAGQLGLCYPLSLLAALTFGSLISATDPVSVLSVFKSCGVHEDVFAIVFGESVLNDAVAIVLTRTLLAFNDGSDGGLSLSSRVSYAAFLFVVEFASSLFIGAIFGAGLALLLRHLQLRKPTTAESPHDDDDVVLTVALCFAFPWASYYTAEALECSGIVTLLFCGTVMATYARPHMSADAARVSSAAFKCAGFIAETGGACARRRLLRARVAMVSGVGSLPDLRCGSCLPVCGVCVRWVCAVRGVQSLSTWARPCSRCPSCTTRRGASRLWRWSHAPSAARTCRSASHSPTRRGARRTTCSHYPTASCAATRRSRTSPAVCRWCSGGQGCVAASPLPSPRRASATETLRRTAAGSPWAAKPRTPTDGRGTAQRARATR